jgi:hypothetical protein
MATVPHVLLTGNETTAELIALGLVKKEQRYLARQRGYYCTGTQQPAYPQLNGPGGYQTLANPLFFVKKIILTETRNTSRYIDEDTIQEWIQEALCRCWERRHAPHVQHWSSYYFAMVRGLVRQWIVKYKREADRRIPLFKETHHATA